MLSAKVWRGASGGLPEFPEQRLEELRARPNNALSFSGGGVRAFSATLGYLVALHELELLPRARYGLAHLRRRVLEHGPSLLQHRHHWPKRVVQRAAGVAPARDQVI